ncbi:FtsX-like permease family protein [Salinicoccus sesuvii]|uniref:FtsX-like permease family protein n=2 Tax=Salinicoccus sesuvii TaxID=868281 RepID=A0ABV7N4W7_9STAP
MSKDDSAADELASGTMMSTGFLVGSVLLIIIIVTFVMFANSIFLKRRNTELALFQLIGLNISKVFRILLLENAIIYFGSLIMGILFGFLLSRVLLMVLLSIMQIELSIGLNFSMEAVIQTAVLFIAIFILLLAQNFLFLKRTKLIDMITLDRTNESDNRRLGTGTLIMGVLGIGMIALGYYLSTELVDSIAIIIPLTFAVLGLTIVGTYITFKFSVSFLLNIIRKSKRGHVNVTDVLSLTRIMFNIKSNAFLLTIISIISALSIGLMSLAYITYYSVEQTVENTMPRDYTFYDEEGLDYYATLLNEAGVDHQFFTVKTTDAVVKEEGAIQGDLESLGFDEPELNMAVVSDADFDGISLQPNQTVITGTSTLVGSFIDYTVNEGVTFVGDDYERTLELIDVEDQSVLSNMVSYGSPVAIVDGTVYKELMENRPQEIQGDLERTMYAIDITEGDSMEIFNLMDREDRPAFASKIQQYTTQMQANGLAMFIIAFVGFSFLLTSGCILYFKQVGESEDEKGSYTVLRKLGFSEREIIKGLSTRMVITFGIPLLIGLLHAYFAVNAGWFLFGTEMWTPMLIVMGVYTVLYSIFAVLSLLYYKRVVRESLN